MNWKNRFTKLSIGDYFKYHYYNHTYDRSYTYFGIVTKLYKESHVMAKCANTLENVKNKKYNVNVYRDGSKYPVRNCTKVF